MSCVRHLKKCILTIYISTYIYIYIYIYTNKKMVKKRGTEVARAYFYFKYFDFDCFGEDVSVSALYIQ